ncbi:hypothetical protein BJ322DRAFT_1086998 [Thelephora terrestris]|uniref:Nudix hydrolase domain-containing protein n=1 Tax=Thelephora terrestris TaxID=56493 RepID=A0A9P6L2Z3_9AGAM|nr:hypothetical protein BJ322DRAFT_1086998 [Thelephora terrestris]
MVSASSVKNTAGPSVPRPSASLIVVNDRNEILLVQRNPNSRSFAGAHVFPGGNFDEDDGCHRVTAIRETFEETGLLLARSRVDAGSERSAFQRLDQDVLNRARQSILLGQMAFSKFLDDAGLTPAVDELLPFTEWITPVQVPRRFHARFYVTFLRDTTPSPSGFSHGSKRDFVPTPDGGQEVISARFVHPVEALRAHEAKEMLFMPPQHYLVHVLAEVLGGEGTGEEEEAQRERVRRLAAGAFGRMVVMPRQMKGGGDGSVVLAFEGDEVVGGRVGARHRSVIVPGPGGVPTEIELQRNVDVFETGGVGTTRDAKL